MLIAGTNPIFPIHVFERSRSVYCDDSPAKSGTKVRRRQLKYFSRLNHSVNSAAFLFANAHTPHQACESFISGLVFVDKSLDWQIDSPRLYRGEQLPRLLSWETVQSLLASIDWKLHRDRRSDQLLEIGIVWNPATVPAGNQFIASLLFSQERTPVYPR